MDRLLETYRGPCRAGGGAPSTTKAAHTDSAHQLRLEDRSSVRVLRDLLVEHGLREEGLVDLVVSHASVADHVDDAVLAVLR